MILSLKRAFAFGATVVLLAALSVYGMNLLAGKSTTPIASVTTASPLELKLELQKTEFEQSEPINITVSLKNVGKTTITVTFSSGYHRVYYRIFDINGTTVYIDPVIWLAALDPVTLAPNAQVSQTYTWNQIKWFLVGDTVVRQEQAPKGTYTIVGKTRNFFIGDGLPLSDLETPPVTITIK